MPTTTYHPWIAGQGHPGGRPTEPVHNPWTGAVEAEAAVATAEDLERAIAAAVTAFPAFRATPPRQRREILERCARRLDAERDGLARTIALEVGKPITQALGEVDRAVLTFSLAADAARAPEGEVLSLGFDPRYPAGVARTRRVPLGPVAAIAPFNYPLNLVAHKVAPALAVGAPVVLKPAPQGPGAAFRLAEILAECGLPAGALSVLHLPVPLAESLATDPRLPVLTFTGSAAVGWHLRARAATKRVLLELGGNGATVVHEDWGHPGAVAAKVVGAAFAYAGQVCTKTQRLLVHAPIADEVREAVVAAARALPVGDPLRPETVVGPVISGSGERGEIVCTPGPGMRKRISSAPLRVLDWTIAWRNVSKTRLPMVARRPWSSRAGNSNSSVMLTVIYYHTSIWKRVSEEDDPHLGRKIHEIHIVEGAPRR